MQGRAYTQPFSSFPLLFGFGRLQYLPLKRLALVRVG